MKEALRHDRSFTTRAASKADAGPSDMAQRPWQTPVVISSTMADAENFTGDVADGGGTGTKS